MYIRSSLRRPNRDLNRALSNKLLLLLLLYKLLVIIRYFLIDELYILIYY